MTTPPRLEIEGQEQFILTTSVATDEAPLFNIKNPAGTAISSIGASNSGDGFYYAFAPVPTTPGWYTQHWFYTINAQTFYEVGMFEAIESLAIEEAGLYCNANEVVNLFPKLAEGGWVNREIGGVIQDIMAEVDAKLGVKYSVPFATGVSSMPTIVPAITKHLALTTILERRPSGDGSVPEWVTARAERYRGIMDSIIAGEMTLVTSDGSVLGASAPSELGSVEHSMEDYVPTFNMLPWSSQRIDPDRLTEEEDEL
jgi:hypothetical protein